MLSVCHNLLDAKKENKEEESFQESGGGTGMQIESVAFQFPGKYLDKRRSRFRFPRTAKAQIKL